MILLIRFVGIISRFNLHVDDQHMVSSDPNGPPSCWHPVIIPINYHDISLTLGQSVTLQLIVIDNHIQVNMVAVDGVKISQSESAEFISTTNSNGASNGHSNGMADSNCGCGYSKPVEPQSGGEGRDLDSQTILLSSQEIYR